jgi:hypothetical protein
MRTTDEYIASIGREADVSAWRQRLLLLSRQIAELNQAIAGEALRPDAGRGLLEASSGRLLKVAAQLYAATLPPAPIGAAAVTTQRPPVVPADALLATFNGERHAA